MLFFMEMLSSTTQAVMIPQALSGRKGAIDSSEPHFKDTKRSLNGGPGFSVGIIVCLLMGIAWFQDGCLVLGNNTEYGLNDESVASGEDLRTQDNTYILVLVAVSSICFVLVLGTSLNCYFRKRLKMHEDGRPHIDIPNESLEFLVEQHVSLEL